jgi:hypothetical protein
MQKLHEARKTSANQATIRFNSFEPDKHPAIEFISKLCPKLSIDEY